ncbi:MAG: DUF692 family protein [Polyangiaceae bacterium]|nr:DUF692 family protein [Polyangiaceae bacterium]
MTTTSSNGSTNAPRGGVGLGLRWSFLEDVLASVRGEAPALPVDFFEVCPENYMRRGGYIPAALSEIREAVPILSHGLTMSLGGLDPFDDSYVRSLAAFVRDVGAPFHSDHLCFGGANGKLVHDLLPIPFLEEAVTHVVDRARQMRDRLGCPLAIENISYYVRPGASEMNEADFIRTIAEEADVGLLLDVNNVYVNAKNFGFDAEAFIDALPLDRVVQIHVAGHEYRPQHGRIIDTHGADAPPGVLALLEHVIEAIGPVPVILERDSHVPPLDTLLVELRRVRAIYDRALAKRSGAVVQREVRRRAKAPSARLAPLYEIVVASITEPQAMQERAADRVGSIEGRGLQTRDAESLAAIDDQAWFVYRHLVRGTLRSVIQSELPRTHELLGDRFDADIDAFVADALPSSHYLRDVPFEFVRFIGPRWEADVSVPPFAAELARHELVAFESAAALRPPAAPDRATIEAKLELEGPVYFDESVRLSRYGHPVHELAAGARTLPARPTALLVYRDAAHELRTLELSSLVADVVERLLDRRILRDAIVGACERANVALAPELLGDLARVLADYADRGILLGTAPSASVCDSTSPAPAVIDTKPSERRDECG